MSSANSTFTPLPSQTGEPYSVEPIEGTGKLRITRRGSVPVAMVEHSDRLAEVIEPYGTPDGVSAGGDTTRRPVPDAKRWADAFLVEIRVVPKGDRSPANDQGAPDLRLVEKVYEQTPYERTTGTTTDAQGALISVERTVVCAVGQPVPAAPAGYARVVVSQASDGGRQVYSVRDVVGEGVTGTTLAEDGEGIIMEEGSYNTMTEPAKPAPGEFASWTKVPQGGYWRVQYSKVAAEQLPAPGRRRVSWNARPDGSVSQSVTEAGAAPACEPEDVSPLSRPVVLVGQSEYTRQGGIVGRTKHWLFLPFNRTEAALVRWRRPGLVTLAGTIGSAGDAFLRILPPVERQYAGQRVYAYGLAADVYPELPWQANAWAAWTVAGTVRDANGSPEPVLDTGNAPGCLSDISAVSGATDGKWNGKAIVSLAVDAYSDPAARPTGWIVTGGGDVRLYAVDFNDPGIGQAYYERITERADVS